MHNRRRESVVFAGRLSQDPINIQQSMVYARGLQSAVGSRAHSGAVKCMDTSELVKLSDVYCSCGNICFRCQSIVSLQVTDTKPKRPSWGLMSSSSEGVATAIAAWGHFVIMGDTEGSLNRWDTQTGRISTVQTTQVRPFKIAPSQTLAVWNASPSPQTFHCIHPDCCTITAYACICMWDVVFFTVLIMHKDPYYQGLAQSYFQSTLSMMYVVLQQNPTGNHSFAGSLMSPSKILFY